jgi:hypothetical protein
MRTMAASAQTAPASPGTAAPPASLTVKYGIEYWVRASYTSDFDFDGQRADGDGFGWQRVKPFVDLQKGGLELMLQGQDARSYGVPALNPNGTTSYTSRTSQLDFVKAYLKITPRPGLSFKVGREQADGIDLGVSRKLASSSNYGTVLKSFDLVSARWERRGGSLMAFVADPVDNLPYELNHRHQGELFAGVQAVRTARRNTHRVYAVRRSTDARGPASETGVRGASATYALGVQESGPLGIPGLTWDAEGLFEWGHRSTDRVRAGAVWVNATHTFSPSHAVYAGLHQSSGDGRRGDGTTHLFDTLYSSGFNNYGYMGLSQGRNIADVRLGGTSVVKGPATLLWTYHEQFLSVRRDQWYAIFTPNIDQPGATSSHLGREIDATLLLRFPFARKMTIALGYLAFQPGKYLSARPHKTAQQFAIDINGQF